MTREQAVTLVETWKVKYNVVAEKGQDIGCDDYCIGGVVMKEFDAEYKTHFPTVESLSCLLLQVAGNTLQEYETRKYAVKIIDRNDRELFDEAWNVVVEVLCSCNLSAIDFAGQLRFLPVLN